MTKSERRECAKFTGLLHITPETAGIMARSLSALIRAARTTKSRNELITFAANWPAVVNHPDFIV